MMKIILYGFGNPDNRGCEAILRSISLMLKKKLSNLVIVAQSNDYGRVKMVDIETIDAYRKGVYPHEKTLGAFVALVLNKVANLGKLYYNVMNLSNYIYARDAAVCISIGGDNYCYTSKNEWLYSMDETYKGLGKVVIHWGSSFETTLIDESMKRDLEKFDLIMVRESLSADTLKEHKINTKVLLYPDPAFMMDAEHVKLEPIWNEDNIIGINLSPLILSYEGVKGMLLSNIKNLIQYIKDFTHYRIAFIPHVSDRRTGQGDYSEMHKYVKQISDNSRLIFVDYKYSAPQYKYIISRCRMFVGARTHATIAAYSSCVPTLVLGYSVKSRGIAKDIFGTFENYVMPVQSLKNENDLVTSFKWLMENEIRIRQHLKEFMPGYIARAGQAVEEVKKLIVSHSIEN